MTTNTIPDDMAARVARLINEAEDMRQQAADDLKQIYADLREELRGLGWDGKHVSAEVAALKGAIGEMRLDEKAKEKREEKGERVDDYVSLLTRARARGEHKNDRREGESNAKLIATVATGMQTEIGRKALTTALGIMIEREEADEFQAKASDDNGATEQDIEDTADSVTGDASRSSRGDDSPAINPEMDRATEGSFETGSEAAEKGREAIPAGPEGADLSHAGAGESPAAYCKPKPRLRPNCQHPELCASGTADHCWSCRRAMQKSEDAT